jgi:hypothetical protein
VRNVVVVGDLMQFGTRLDDGCIQFRIPESEVFKRGDMDGNGIAFALVDAIFMLTFAFSEGPAPPCMDATDADDNGSSSALVDVIFLLAYAFNEGATPPAPGPEACGPDPTDDALDCAVVAAACE